MASRQKFWPRPRPQTFGLGLASISSYYVIGHFRAKIVKIRILLIFPAVILNRVLLIIIYYFFIIIFGRSLGLEVSASFNVTGVVIVCNCVQTRETATRWRPSADDSSARRSAGQTARRTTTDRHVRIRSHDLHYYRSAFTHSFMHVYSHKHQCTMGTES